MNPEPKTRGTNKQHAMQQREGWQRSQTALEAQLTIRREILRRLGLPTTTKRGKI
jgi:hypothetical protein